MRCMYVELNDVGAKAGLKYERQTLPAATIKHMCLAFGHAPQGQMALRGFSTCTVATLRPRQRPGIPGAWSADHVGDALNTDKAPGQGMAPNFQLCRSILGLPRFYAVSALRPARAPCRVPCGPPTFINTRKLQKCRSECSPGRPRKRIRIAEETRAHQVASSRR